MKVGTELVAPSKVAGRISRVLNCVSGAGEAGAADGGLRVALGATVAVECRAQTHPIFTGDASGDRVNLLEALLCLIEECLLIATQGWEKAACCRRAWSRARIVLRQ